MLTRRENLLIRPWQQRRYNNHRRKVQSALPAIDVGPPPTRGHVCCKLKKLQWEQERCARIEEDNFRLLQRMGTIMKKNTLDNHWVTAPPNFLHRIGIYYQHGKSSPYSEASSGSTSEERLTRKERCLACNPRKEKSTKLQPEERVPWEPIREKMSHARSSSTTITQTSKAGNSRASNQPQPECGLGLFFFTNLGRHRTGMSTDSSTRPQSKGSEAEDAPQRLMLTRGALHLAVNIPANTTIKLRNNKQDRVLQREYCECKAMKTRKQR